MPRQAERRTWSWQLPAARPAAPTRTAATTPPRTFRRAVAFTVAGTAIPGLGLIAGRRRLIGSIILGLFAAGLLALGIYGVFDSEGLLARAVDPTTLGIAAVALVVLGLVWVSVIIASHLSLRDHPTRDQRVVGGILVGLLSFAVAAPMAVAAHYSYVTASSVAAVFQSEKDTKSATRPTLEGAGSDPDPQDPWAGKPRLNILLLGGDAGPGRDRDPHRHRDLGKHLHKDWRHYAVQSPPQCRSHALPIALPVAQVLPVRVHQREWQRR